MYLRQRDGELLVVFGAAVSLLEFHDSVDRIASGFVHHLAHVLLHLPLTLLQPGLMPTQVLLEYIIINIITFPITVFN